MQSLREKVKQIRDDSESRNIVKNVIFSFVIKGGSMVVALLTTPAYIRYFNNNTVLGLWFTMISLLTWMYNFDFGIGNGVRNKIVKTIHDDDEDETRRYISSAYIFLALISIIAFFIISTLVGFLDLNSLLGVDAIAMKPEDLLIAARILLLSVMLQLVLRLITSIAYALQYAFVPSLMSLITSLSLLAYVTISNRLGNNGDISRLGIAYLLAVNVPLITLTVILFKWRLCRVRPHLKFFSWFHAKDSLKLGTVFLYLQLTSMLMSNSASFLISYIFGAENVVEYQLYYRIFSLVFTIMALVLTPMWSAITKALAEGRTQWMRKLFIVMFSFVILSTLFELLIVPFLQFIFDIWLRENTINVSVLAAVLFAIYGSVFVWQYVCSCISNGLGKLKIQVVGMTVGIVLGIGLAVAFSRMWNSYLAIVIGMISGYLPFCIAQTVWTFHFCKGDQI